jgi:hypothetical protein
MIKQLLVICALTSPLLLSGCVISVGGDGDGYYGQDWEKRETNNRRHISELDTDMTLESISNRMGLADFDESHQQNSDDYRVLYYRTQRLADDGMTTKDECTPLVFKNGRLTGWGNSALREHL